MNQHFPQINCQIQDFCDKIWKNSIGRKEAAFFQKRALPLSLLAASALADLELPRVSDLVVHCILDGNIAPFSDPHDWSTWVCKVDVVEFFVIPCDIVLKALILILLKGVYFRVQGPTNDAAFAPGFIHSFSILFTRGYLYFTKWVAFITGTM